MGVDNLRTMCDLCGKTINSRIYCILQHKKGLGNQYKRLYICNACHDKLDELENEQK